MQGGVRRESRMDKGLLYIRMGTLKILLAFLFTKS